MDLQTKTLTSLAEMADFEQNWLALEQTSSAGFGWFQSYSWCYSWMVAFGNRNIRPHVLVFMSAEKIVAILPLMIEINRLGLRVASILGEPQSQYANMLTAKDKIPIALAQSIAKTISDLPSIDFLSFSTVPDASALAQVLQHLPTKVHCGNHSAQVALAKTSAVINTKGHPGNPNSRTLRRSEKAMAKLGDVTLDVLRPGEATYVEQLELCIQMKLTWLRNTGRYSSGIGRDKLGFFLAAVESKSIQNEGPLLFILRAGQRIVAVELGFLQRGHYYCFLGAFDWALREASPGKLQIFHSISWLITQGVKTFDLLGTLSDYKMQTATSTTQLLQVNLAKNWRGKAYASLWLERGKPRVKRWINSSPFLANTLSRINWQGSK